VSTDEFVTAKQASISGGFARSWLRLSAVFCWLFILLVPAMAVFGEIEWSWWQLALAQILFTVVMLVVGFWAWFEADEAAADTKRLQRDGRDAIAEIIDLDVTDPGDGSHDVARLQLKISGEDVPEFHAVHRDAHDKKTYVIGARFKAVVDPSDNLFTLAVLKRS
jgi:hypothetical protein